MDKRETTTTQEGTYIVFLIAEDLSVTYLTLNQGMTELRNRLKDRGAAEEMVRVAESVRPSIQELKKTGFLLDNDIDLKSGTAAAKNYKIGTIAHILLPNDDLPDDAKIEELLDGLLSAYQRVIETPPEKQPIDAEGSVKVTDAIAAVPYGIDDAIDELFLERDDVERFLDIWAYKKNMILQGAPGVGKSFVARRLAYALIGFRDDTKLQTVQFHQSYSYEDFVQGYRPNGSQGFERKNGTFYEFRDRAGRDPGGTYVFIIDEINRGNLSKIFGELMLLIEPDKRGPDWKTRLAYASDEDPDFYIPENLFVLGMMNTADRSLSLVDYALRRRFAFVGMEPLYGAPKFRAYLEERSVSEEFITRVINRMAELNQAIESDRTNLGPGFRIGHSFFTPTKCVDDSEAWYRRIVETEIHPLLEEYWFDAPETADQWRDRLLR
ncbi:dynein-related subfamily AAA family protein [Primorskyibacter sedentarius]|uniref:Dynein-related subfamily AAA family protein n=2 Tax=Primorskyibacter sedentarius TaxID=745311 RepID=A0A4R3JK42_9RHOB|nr:dynein-related subfamily AAA family protein [Primorskyibacter sedentarius]